MGMAFLFVCRKYERAGLRCRKLVGPAVGLYPVAMGP